MSKVIELTDEQYSALASIAARNGETPRQFIERLLEALVQTHGTIYYSDDELLRALGADDQELSELEELVRRTGAAD
jgi:negative regulator of replication initiation